MNEQIYDKIKEISDILSNSNLNDISLLSGNTGIALFELYISKIQNNEKLKDSAINRIETVFNEIENTENIQFSFCSGLAGLGWFFEFANENNLDNFETNLILEDIDECLSKILKYHLSTNNWDFLHGAIGIGYYFLSRLENNENIFANIVQIIDFLEMTSLKDNNNNVFWKTNDYERNKSGINISLSHGISSIIMFLLKIKQKNILKKRVEKLIFLSIDFVLSQEIDKNKYNCYFPNFSIESEEDLYSSRLAWCYGDLGIATSIYNVGKAFNRQDLIEQSIEVLLFAANQRRDLEKNKVIDAGICHGTVGIATIFYRMWWNTKIYDFKTATDYWIGKTIDIAKFPDGLAGYKSFHRNKGWINNYSIIEGIAGIGLVLTSYLYEVEPKWDNCLLLS